MLKKQDIGTDPSYSLFKDCSQIYIQDRKEETKARYVHIPPPESELMCFRRTVVVFKSDMSNDILSGSTISSWCELTQI